MSSVWSADVRRNEKMTEDPKDNREQPQGPASSEFRPQTPDAQPTEQSADPGATQGAAPADRASHEPGQPSQPGTQQPQTPGAGPDSGAQRPGSQESAAAQSPYAQSASAQSPFGPPASGQPESQDSTFGLSSSGSSQSPYARPSSATPAGQPPFGQAPQESSFAQQGFGQQPESSGQTGFGQSPFTQPPFPYAQPGAQQPYSGQFPATDRITGSGSVPPEYSPYASQEMPTQHTAPMPPYPHAYGSGGGQQPPTGPMPAVGGDPYGSQHNTAAFATAAPPRRGRSGLVAGAIVLALVAGGIGGAVGAVIADSGNGSSVSNALDNSTPNAQSASVTAPAGSVQAVAQKVVPSVVMIKVTGDRAEGEGSGVILSSDGLILTNNHVASGAGRDAKMQVQFKDGSVTSASVVGVDPISDLAVIKAANKSGLTPIDLGTSKNLQVGQPVVAVGSPLGLAGTVTTGIVSALNRPVSTSGESGSTGTVISAVQTDAPINPGNSGGALVDMNGKLIGINTAIATLGGSDSSQQSGSIGLGFAIPVDQVRRVANELIKTGHATYAQIGMTVLNQAPSDVNANGAVVKDVTAGGPADKAGIPAGVVVTKLGDLVIDNGDALVAAVRAHQPGDKVSLTYTDTNGQNPKTVQVTLAGAAADGAH
jgi:putative serine protease PepD